MLLMTAMAQTLKAQTHCVFSEDIASLQVHCGDDWLSVPIISMNKPTPLVVSFDDKSHEYRRFGYRLQHMEADWSESQDIFESDYLEGIYDQLIIEDHEESINTATLYTHYRVQIPNEDVRIKLSGNYRLTIFDDNGDHDEALAEVCFMVCEDAMSVGLNVVTNTDIDINHSHQQVEMKVNYNALTVTDPDRQLHTVVMQNGRWMTARRDARPQFRTPSALEWKHCRDYIFDAGNAFRRFEYLDIHRNSLGVDHTDFDGSNYHVWLYPDEPRKNYVHDESPQGAFIVRNTDNYENDTASEYFLCHFTYDTEEPFDGRMFVSGRWTQDALMPQYEMLWDAGNHRYHCCVPLKMGFYSYQYLLQRPDGTIVNLPSDGNYFQTANSYQALVYYRPVGGRTDRLVGYTSQH